jgi:hypothetical protein
MEAPRPILPLACSFDRVAVVPPCSSLLSCHSWGGARCHPYLLQLVLGLGSGSREGRVELDATTGEVVFRPSRLAGVSRPAAIDCVLIFISHQRKEVYQRTRKREESEVRKAAPPGGSPPAITASGAQSDRGWGRLAFRPVRSKGGRGRVGRCLALGRSNREKGACSSFSIFQNNN